MPERSRPPELSHRALNRALLARQGLLERWTNLDAAAAIERLVALQAQVPQHPYVGLWSRQADFDPAGLARMVEEREAVRLTLLRGTVHLVTARDALALRPLVQPVLDRMVKGQFGRHLEGVDRAALVRAGRALVEKEPMTPSELGRALSERFGGRDALALTIAVQASTPLVQLPPRGLWGRSGRTYHTTLSSWLGAELDRTGSLDDLFLRYLAAFGPASVMDAQNWSGLTRLRAVAERLRPRLLTFRDPAGVELFDLPDAPRPDPGVPAPPRFLPAYDNIVLGHADRSRIVPAELRAGAAPFSDAALAGSLLVGGMVGAAWRIHRDKERATLAISAPRRPAQRDVAAIEREGRRLLAFAVPGASRWDVIFRM